MVSTFFENYIANISITQELGFLLRIIISGVCGAMIGFERTRRFKEAGIRTHILVASASALMMIVSKYGFADLQFGEIFLAGTKGADASRIAAQVICGISFLGAGVIFKHGASVKGLTTAAGIWATSGIGLAIGAGMYFEGIFVAALVVGSQMLMHKISVGKDAVKSVDIKVTVRDAKLFRKEFTELILNGKGNEVSYRSFAKNDNGNTVYKITVVINRRESLDALILHSEENPNIVSFDISPANIY